MGVLAGPLVRSLRSAGATVGGVADELLGALTTHTPVGVFISEADGACVYVNERWCELTGLSFADALGDGWAVALHPDDRERVGREWEAAASAERDSTISYRFRRPDGTEVWIEGYASCIRDETGTLVGWVGSCLDVSAHQIAERALLLERELFRVAFEDAPIGMVLVALDATILRANSAISELLGYSEAELQERGLHGVTHPDDLEMGFERMRQLASGEIESYRLEKRYVRRDGSPFWASLSVGLVRDEHGEPLHFVGHIEDIHERKLAEQELRFQAERDPLTGLMNRRPFELALDLWQHRVAQGAGEASLILLDIDNFKQINDSLGHQAGDEALVALSRVLLARLRETDAVARIGGDEFAILAQGSAGLFVAEALLADLRAAVILPGELAMSASAGVVTITAGVDAVKLLATADSCLYRAKKAGRDRACFEGRCVGAQESRQGQPS